MYITIYHLHILTCIYMYTCTYIGHFGPCPIAQKRLQRDDCQGQLLVSVAYQ